MYKYVVRVPMHVPRVTLGAYVRRAFSLLPESAVRAAFEARDVKMDGKRCKRDEMVRPGAEVAVFTPWRIEMPVVYEDDDLLALDKPAGVSCDADAYGSITVLDWAAFYAGEAFAPRMCHRLDNGTSGLIVLAKTDQAEAALQAMFARHDGNKTYACIVVGKPEPSSTVRTAWLTKDAAHARVRVSDRETADAKRIETAYEVLQSGDISLLRVTLHTGRTHQIRVHMAHLGYPILGDDLYGDREANRLYKANALMLRSVQLTIDTQGALPQIDGKTLKVPIKIDDIYNNIK